MGSVALIEKEENKGESFISSLGLIRKFHPLAFMLMFALMYFFTKTLSSSMPLPEKIIFLFFSGTLYVLTFVFEVHRIDQQQRQKEKVWS